MLSRVTEGNGLPTVTSLTLVASTSVIWVGHMQLLSLVLSLCFVFAVGVRACVCVDTFFFCTG